MLDRTHSGTYGRHLATTIERSVLGDDAGCSKQFLHCDDSELCKRLLVSTIKESHVVYIVYSIMR